jgi:hypothetical protein
MFFHNKVGVIGVRYRPDVDQTGFTHHAEHEPAFAFHQLSVLVAITGNK